LLAPTQRLSSLCMNKHGDVGGRMHARNQVHGTRAATLLAREPRCETAARIILTAHSSADSRWTDLEGLQERAQLTPPTGESFERGGGGRPPLRASDWAMGQKRDAIGNVAHRSGRSGLVQRDVLKMRMSASSLAGGGGLGCRTRWGHTPMWLHRCRCRYETSPPSRLGRMVVVTPPSIQRVALSLSSEGAVWD
jgi:hypothetical protein